MELIDVHPAVPTWGIADRDSVALERSWLMQFDGSPAPDWVARIATKAATDIKWAVYGRNVVPFGLPTQVPRRQAINYGVIGLFPLNDSSGMDFGIGSSRPDLVRPILLAQVELPRDGVGVREVLDRLAEWDNWIEGLSQLALPDAEIG